MCYWALVWLTLANSTCTKYGAVQAELSAGDTESREHRTRN